MEVITLNRNKALHVRMTEVEKQQVANLKDAYGLTSETELVLLILDYVDVNRPTLTKRVQPLKKVIAPRVAVYN